MAMQAVVAMIIVLIVAGTLLFIWQKNIFRASDAFGNQNDRIEECSKNPTSLDCLNTGQSQPQGEQQGTTGIR